MSASTAGAAALWWYPYDAGYARLMAGARRALRHVAAARLRGQLGLLRSARLWRRVGAWRLLASLDKLF